MTFSPEQIKALAADLDKRNVKSRSQSGRSLSYVEGWHVIAEANRIFGFSGWTSETTEIRLVAERERKIGQAQKDGWGVSYVAKVKVVAFAGDTIVTREGVGAGHGIDADLGQAHESAIKEAETDARKRALMTFGNPFGLALYDKEQAHVSNGDGTPATQARQRPAEARTAEQIIAAVEEAQNTMALNHYLAHISRDGALERLSETDHERVRQATIAKRKTFTQEAA